MNYYERHIGDYLKDTAHLSLLEHGVYTRLIDVYYTRESAIPSKDVARLIAARSKDERDALTAVLEEFFVLIDGAYSQKRCDAEIGVYHEKTSDRDDARAGEKERQRRARERRKAAFEVLRAHGIVPPWNATGKEIEALMSRVTGDDKSQPVTPPVTRDNTASQSPVPSHQTPEEQGARPDATTLRALPAEAEPAKPSPVPGSGSPYGLAVLAMRQQGMADANPGHSTLRALVDAGVSIEEFQAVSAEAVGKQRGFAWALATLTNRRRDAAAAPIAAKPAPNVQPTNPDVAVTQARLEAEAARPIARPPAELLARRLARLGGGEPQ